MKQQPSSVLSLGVDPIDVVFVASHARPSLPLGKSNLYFFGCDLIHRALIYCTG